LLFMGSEFGQFSEWYEGRGLDWMLLDFDMHAKLHGYTRELFRYYRGDRCFWLNDDNWRGFEWIDCHDYSQSVVSFLRKADDREFTVVVSNFTPVVRHGYRIGVPRTGRYREVLNSDWVKYGGSGVANGAVWAEKVAWHSQPCSLVLTLPPLATVYLRWEAGGEEGEENTYAKKGMRSHDSRRRSGEPAGRADQDAGQAGGALRRQVPAD